MATNKTIQIPAHPNIYNGANNRELEISFSLPTAWGTRETGIVLFVPGFGGNMESKVYKRMRETFAEKYNLITIQCSYFGDVFKQSAENFTLENSNYYIEKHLTKN